MRHPTHPSFRLPATFTALAEVIMDGLDPADPDTWRFASWIDNGGDLFGGDLDPALLGQPIEAGDPAARCGELHYDLQPLEILPFCWSGRDALHYGWAVLAPELDSADHPCVSFAPMDDRAVWLGDNTKQALGNLLTEAVSFWSNGSRELPSPMDHHRWQAICEVLDLRPDPESWVNGPARSKRALSPEVPPGWRYEPTGDGIGVLAPESAFTPEPVHVGQPHDGEGWRTVARVFLDDGRPGSALAVLKSLDYYDRNTVDLMREAYLRLGRELHAERAEFWLRLHPEEWS